MRVCRSLQELRAARPGPTVVAPGTFDGVHLGHAAVLGEVVRRAGEKRARPAALVFSRPPRAVLAGEPSDLVTSPGHRLELIARLGVELALAMDFTPELARLGAERFAEEYLAGAFAAVGLVLGPDGRLGPGEAGGGPGLVRLGARLGFEVWRVGPVTACGTAASSSALRQAVLDGRLELAECLLGRRVSVQGAVMHGQGRGRLLGYPTLNLDVHREVRPPMGVYAALARVGGRAAALPAVVNVGFRPTFPAPAEGGGLRPDLLVEVHLLSGDGDLYGRTVEVEFVRLLREERRFDSDAELAAQIARDAAEARAVLAGPRQSP